MQIEKVSNLKFYCEVFGTHKFNLDSLFNTCMEFKTQLFEAHKQVKKNVLKVFCQVWIMMM